MELRKKEINRILSNWNIGTLVSFKKMDKGEVNYNWFIKTDKSNFIIRRVTKDKSVSELNFEIKYLQYLKDKGFRYEIPQPIVNKNGKFILNYSLGNFWLYKFIEGKNVDKFGKNELKQIAEMLATYHKIIVNSGLNNRKGKISPFARNEVLKELSDFRNKIKYKHKKELIFLSETKKLISILESIEDSAYNKLPQYPVHRDPNPENIIWKNGKLSGVIDFDNVSQCNDILIKDLAVVLQFGCSDKKHVLNLKYAKFFLDEYRKLRVLSKEEIELFPDMITGILIEDFSYAYWMLINDPERAKLDRLKRYSKAAQLYQTNKNKIINAIK